MNGSLQWISSAGSSFISLKNISKCSVLLSTHIVSDIEHIADEVLMMKDGNLIYHGPWDEQMGDLERFYLTQFEEDGHE